jgi:hypothetical protein
MEQMTAYNEITTKMAKYEMTSQNYIPFELEDFLNTESFSSLVFFSACCLFFSSNLENPTEDLECLSPT